MGGATTVLSTLIALLGVAIIVAGIAREDVVRALIGVLFIGAGLGRLYLARRGA